MKSNTVNVCICLDKKTTGILKQTVKRLRSEGNKFVSKSALIRYAIQMQDEHRWADLPKSY